MDRKLRVGDSFLSHRLGWSAERGWNLRRYGKASKKVGLLGATLREEITGACWDRGGRVRKTLETTKRVKNAAINDRLYMEACFKGWSDLGLKKPTR